MLITVLNDGTLITVAYDNVNPSKQPEKWNLKALWWVGVSCSFLRLFCQGPLPSRPRPRCVPPSPEP